MVNKDSKILDEYVNGVIDGRDEQRRVWLAWLEHIIKESDEFRNREYRYDIYFHLNTKIKQLKKELGK